MIKRTKVVVVAEWKVSKSKRWKVTGPIRETERDYTNYRVKLSEAIDCDTYSNTLYLLRYTGHTQTYTPKLPPRTSTGPKLMRTCIKRVIRITYFS
jgi:hypothetical protein